MTPLPEDLVECWHLIVANGDEPVEWMMDDAMWRAVQDAVQQRECIDSGDPLPVESGLVLLGTPVEITATSVPLLRYRREGKLFGTPILGTATEVSPAIRNSHGRGTHG